MRSQKAQQDETAKAREAAASRDEKGRFAAEKGEPAATETATGEDREGDAGTKREEKGRFAVERINTLTREKRQAERERERLASELEALRKAGTAPADGAHTEPKPGAEEDPKPAYKDFETAESYTEALGRWSARQEWKELRAKEAEERKTLRAEEERVKREEAWRTQADAARRAHADWDDVLSTSNVPLPETMVDEIVSSDLGAEIAYYLGRAPDEAARIALLDTKGQIREIAKISAKLESGSVANTQTDAAGEEPAAAPPARESEASDEPERPKRTRAAPPLTPVKGAEKPEPDLEHLAKTNFAKYRAIRNKRHAEYLEGKNG